MTDDWTARADRALTGSIEHWQRVATDTMRDGERFYIADCACCDEWRSRKCAGCPLALRTGQTRCVNTGYVAASDAAEARKDGDEYDQTALDAMVTYLQTTLAMVRSGELAPK